jgi:cell wall-associated NlpC family hydrolase
MIGIGYVWGGTSGDALDCSGFLYRLFHAHGTRLMRDADDLSKLGTPTETWRMQPGDFIFYTDVSTGPVTHVGMFWGKNQLIDAEPDRGITIHTLEEVSKNYVFHSVRQVK